MGDWQTPIERNDQPQTFSEDEENGGLLETIIKGIADSIMSMVDNFGSIISDLTDLFDRFVLKPINELNQNIAVLFHDKVYNPLVEISEILNKGGLEIVADVIKSMDGIPKNISSISSELSRLVYQQSDEYVRFFTGYYWNEANWADDFHVPWGSNPDYSFYYTNTEIDPTYGGIFDTVDSTFDNWDDSAFSVQYKMQIFFHLLENRANRRMIMRLIDSNNLGFSNLLSTISSGLQINSQYFDNFSIILKDILSKLSSGNQSETIKSDFDYDRLAEMLSEIQMSFNVGDFFNESGTNLMDVLNTIAEKIGDALNSLIDSIGEGMVAGITELGELARAILYFLESILEWITRLLIPENLDFMNEGFENLSLKFNAKFRDFLILAAQISSVFQPIQADFTTTITIDILGTPFNPDLTLLNSFIFRFKSAVSVVMWLYVAIFTYKKLTGNGDLINDN